MAYAAPEFDHTNSSIDFASAAVPFSIARKPVTLQVGWQRLYQLSADLTGTIDRVPLRPPGPATLVFAGRAGRPATSTSSRWRGR